MTAVSQGDYSVNVTVSGSDAVGQLGNGMRSSYSDKQATEQRERELAEQERQRNAAETTQSTRIASKGRYPARCSRTSRSGRSDPKPLTSVAKKPVDELAAALDKMFRDLRQIVQDISESANQFAEGSRLISNSSQVLASSSSTQAGAVDEISSSVTQLTAALTVFEIML